MNTQELVLTACAFQKPERIPRFDSFWEYPDSWRARLGAPEDLSDVEIWVPDETTFPTRAKFVEESGGWITEVDGWGRTIRQKPGSYFVETLDVPLPPGADPDRIAFDPASMETRYLQGCADEQAMLALLAQAKRRHCVFGKTGGPYLRTTYVRGEAQFLIDIADDPPLARALADKVGEHLAAVGVTEIQHWSLQETGIWIYDDMAYNKGPMFSPASFEKVFLPAYRRMIRAYKEAGAKYVFLHSDGDIRPLLDMLVDAGIDGINPMERRAHMDAAALRKRYPRLILTGGMCNTDTLIHGPVVRIQAEARELIDLGREGGLIIGTHSVSPEIPLEHFAAYDEFCRSYGNFN
ncbi:MAG: uroporphyrinogen decarboxylase family protein, partial [Omnitrophica WOR_2 bacterium]